MVQRPHVQSDDITWYGTEYDAHGDSGLLVQYWYTKWYMEDNMSNITVVDNDQVLRGTSLYSLSGR